MARTAWEGALLMIIGVAMLSYLLPFSVARNVVASLVIAVALIALIIVRSMLWHEGSTPYDMVLFIGILLAVIYLFSFLAFDSSALTTLTVILFGVFFMLLGAVIPLSPVSGSPHTLVTVPHHVTREEIHHSRSFRRGLQPIVEHAPPHHEDVHQSAAFKRGLKAIPLQEPPHHQADVHKSAGFKKGLQPIVEHAPKPSILRRVFRPLANLKKSKHDAAFHHGMTPLREVTADDLHRLGVYDIDEKPKKR